MKEISERAKKIMESNIIIDSLSHGPILWTEDFINASNEMLASNVNPFKIGQELIFEFAKKIVLDDNYFLTMSRHGKNQV